MEDGFWECSERHDDGLDVVWCYAGFDDGGRRRWEGEGVLWLQNESHCCLVGGVVVDGTGGG